MNPTKNEHRRANASMAESVQFGVSLFFVAGEEEARRYLLKCGAPVHVIERILSAPPGARRPYGSHGANDRRKAAETPSTTPPGPSVRATSGDHAILIANMWRIGGTMADNWPSPAPA
ncbi:hypothetical protein [Massilia sp. BJB1822]|uniref:hypothetical protein n=1 Tax=Massilia sp. BJB1822 TaxID=2744470 RepID=UPI001594121E|nr:hypothetical protein [Massilia sp. BJB1822]NVD97758.1 hypothetical protein [Massilia sp. BJB1822]